MSYRVFDSVGRLAVGTSNAAAVLVAACRLAAHGGAIVESDTWGGGYVAIRGGAACVGFGGAAPWDAAMLAERVACAVAYF